MGRYAVNELCNADIRSLNTGKYTYLIDFGRSVLPWVDRVVAIEGEDANQIKVAINLHLIQARTNGGPGEIRAANSPDL